MTALLFGLGAAFLLALTLWLGARWRGRRQLETIDAMLDDFLARRPLAVSELEEGAVSAIAQKLARAQRRMEEEVVQAAGNKEEQLALIANLSHQLKTPLANVMLYHALVMDQSVDAAQRDQFLEKMGRQLEQLDWMLGAFFKMAKLEQGAITFEPLPQPIEATVREAVSAVYLKAEKKGLTLVVEPFEDVRLLHHPKWTAEVFVNLLENAIKYTPAGGAIHIRVEPLELFTEIQFIDNGIGIREEEQAAIFQRFYRSEDVAQLEGAGIGLTLSRLILDQEGGSLSVRSTYGEGSCFSVCLQNEPSQD